MLEVLQRPGDTVYVPPRWWHAVINLPNVQTDECLTLCVTQSAPRHAAPDRRAGGDGEAVGRRWGGGSRHGGGGGISVRLYG